MFTIERSPITQSTLRGVWRASRTVKCRPLRTQSKVERERLEKLLTVDVALPSGEIVKGRVLAPLGVGEERAPTDFRYMSETGVRVSLPGTRGGGTYNFDLNGVAEAAVATDRPDACVIGTLQILQPLTESQQVKQTLLDVLDGSTSTAALTDSQLGSALRMMMTSERLDTLLRREAEDAQRAA